jgi:hypothetical protein
MPARLRVHTPGAIRRPAAAVPVSGELSIIGMSVVHPLPVIQTASIWCACTLALETALPCALQDAAVRQGGWQGDAWQGPQADPGLLPEDLDIPRDQEFQCERLHASAARGVLQQSTDAHDYQQISLLLFDKPMLFYRV